MKALFGFALVALALSSAGCTASASFHSKNGAKYPAIAYRAVICDENEAQLVAQAGGVAIGSIDGKGLANASDEDVAEKAASVAAKSGGTHIVLTDKGEETYSYYHPAERERQCVWRDGVQDCTSTWTPPTVTTRTEPTAKFVVLRVPFERWGSLPENLRPVSD